MGEFQVMRAVRSGMVRGQAGSPRTIVTEGVTTAHAGAEIVRSHPHLWAPVKVDFPAAGAADEARLDAAVNATGARFVEAVRRLAQGLHDRGFDVPTSGVDDVHLAERVVDLSLALADYQTGRSDEPPAARRDQAEGAGGATAPDDLPEIPDAAAAAGVHADPETPEGRKAIRAWARDEGIEVSDHGPLPADVVEQYLAADLTAGDEADDDAES